MPKTTITGLDPAALSPLDANALAVLTGFSADQLAAFKAFVALDEPTVIGPSTAAAFRKVCFSRGVDLSDVGVNAFKTGHQLGNAGALAGKIGPQTAGVYYAVLFPPPAGPRQISAAGRALVESFERLELRAYQDQGGVWTIGYGHTGPDVHEGMVITEAQAVALLEADLATAETAVSRFVTVALSDPQFSALTSLTFNIGTGAFYKSGLLRVLNQGLYGGAAERLLEYNKCKGVTDPGLVRRRAAERLLFLSG